jgi:hypothetical protein
MAQRACQVLRYLPAIAPVTAASKSAGIEHATCCFPRRLLSVRIEIIVGRLVMEANDPMRGSI